MQPGEQARVHGRLIVQHLHRNSLTIRVRPLAPVHGAHAAVTEYGHDEVRADPGVEQPILMLREQGFGRHSHGPHQRVLARFVSAQERLDGFAQFRVVGAFARQTGGARVSGGVGKFVKQGLDALPAGRRDHVGLPPAISLDSHARARRMLR